MAEILKETLAVNPLWTGKGYTGTYTDRFGIKEYLLKGPVTIEGLKTTHQLEEIQINELIPEGDIQ